MKNAGELPITHQAVYRGLPGHTLYINTPVPGDQGSHRHIGSYRYYSDFTETIQTQPFYLVPHARQGPLKEIDLVVTLGRYLERKYRHSGLRVVDIRLPKAQGYCGERLGFRTVLELFPHAGFRRIR